MAVVESPSTNNACLQERETLKRASKGDHGDGSETASTASSDVIVRSPLPTLKPGGFGGFGPGGSWSWGASPASEGSCGSSEEPGLLDCLEPWAFSHNVDESVFESSMEGENEKKEVSAPIALLRSQSDPGPRSSSILTVMQTDGNCVIRWRVDTKKLSSKDRTAVSPSFDLELEGEVVGSFRIILTACSCAQGKAGSSFRKAKGCGLVELKSESPEVLKPILVQASLWTDNANEETQIKYAEPVRHDFSEICVCGVSEEWDFNTAVDQASQTFAIQLIAFSHSED